MAAYRAYLRVDAGDEGRPLGRAGLAPLVTNLQAHLLATFSDLALQGYRAGSAYVWVATRLGRPVIVFEAGEAWEARAGIRTVERFLKNTGWRYTFRLNANTQNAIAPRRQRRTSGRRLWA